MSTHSIHYVLNIWTNIIAWHFGVLNHICSLTNHILEINKMSDLLPALDIETAAVDRHHNDVESIAPANASTLQPSRSLDTIRTQITPNKTILRSDTFLKDENANSAIDSKTLLSKLFSKTFGRCIRPLNTTHFSMMDVNDHYHLNLLSRFRN